MPSLERAATVRIGKDKTEKKAGVPDAVGINDSLVALAVWTKLLEKSKKSEAQLLTALARKKK